MSKRIAIFQPLVLAMMLAVGIGFLFFMLCVWIFCSYEISTRNQEWINESIAILDDGTPAIHKQSYSKGWGETEYLDLTGKKINDEQWKIENKSLPIVILACPSELTYMRELPVNALGRVSSFIVLRPETNFWYLITDGKSDGSGYFIGFDALSKRCIGYLGRSGFSQQIPTEDKYFPLVSSCILFGTGIQPGDNGIIYLISRSQLLEIDLKSRSVKVLMESPDIISIGLLRVAKNVTDAEVSNNLIRGELLLIVNLSDRVVLLDSAGKQVETYPIPEDLHDKGLTFWRVEKNKVVFGRSWDSTQQKLTWSTALGDVLRQDEVTLKKSGPLQDENAEYWKIAFALPEPISIASAMLIVDPLSGYFQNKSSSYSDALREKSLPLLWVKILTVCILSLPPAWLCYRRQRRFAQPWTWLWVGFVFLFGVPGFLGYLYHRRWPVLEKCHVCDKSVPHDREKCSSCGSEFPQPEMKGIEVYA